jgi:hypothetical protein
MPREGAFRNLPSTTLDNISNQGLLRDRGHPIVASGSWRIPRYGKGTAVPVRGEEWNVILGRAARWPGVGSIVGGPPRHHVGLK